MTAVDLVKRFEGFRAAAYQDQPGVWAIGYGTTRGVRPGMRISREQAEKLLREDIRAFAACLQRNVKAPLSQSQYNALLSFVYNLGCGALARSTLLRKLNAGNYAGAAEEFRRWVYAGGKKSKGLVRRRKAERELFLAGTVAPQPEQSAQMAGGGILALLALGAGLTVLYNYHTRT